jgi:hypothetical protein
MARAVKERTEESEAKESKTQRRTIVRWREER